MSPNRTKHCVYEYINIYVFRPIRTHQYGSYIYDARLYLVQVLMIVIYEIKREYLRMGKINIIKLLGGPHPPE